MDVHVYGRILDLLAEADASGVDQISMIEEYAIGGVVSEDMDQRAARRGRKFILGI
jgi:hypothetical protein